MSNKFRMTTLAAAAAIALTTVPAAAAPVGSSNGNATATARILRPLTLTQKQSMNFGDLMLSGAGTWSGAVVSMSRLGVVTCPANVTCSGSTQAATYNVTGTNNQQVTISVPSVTMTHASITGAQLTMTPNAPGTLILTNSGAPGNDFSIGGSITLASDTPDGVYTGTFNVTVDY